MSKCLNDRYGMNSQNDDRSVLCKLLTRENEHQRCQNVNCKNCATTAGQSDRLVEHTCERNPAKIGCGDCSKCTKVEVSKAKRVNLSLNREEQGSTSNKKFRISDVNTETVNIISVIDVLKEKEMLSGSKLTGSDNVLPSEKSKSPVECPDLSGNIPVAKNEFITPITEEKNQHPSTVPDVEREIGSRKGMPLQKAADDDQKTCADICSEYSATSVSQISADYMTAQESQDISNTIDRPFVKLGEIQNTSTNDVLGSRMLMTYLARKDFLERQKLMLLAVRENIDKQRKRVLEYYDSETVGIDRQLLAVNEELLQVYRQV